MTRMNDKKKVKVRLIAMLLVIVCILSACSGQETKETIKYAEEKSRATAGVDSATGEWTGTGSIYKLAESGVSGNTISVLTYDHALYYLTLSAENAEEYRLQKDDQNILYTTSHLPDIFLAAASEDGIWVLEGVTTDGERNNLMSYLSKTGEVKKTIDLNSVYQTDSIISSILCTSGNLYLVCENELIVLSEEGRLICTIGLSAACKGAALGNDGQIYVAQETDNGNHISKVDLSAEELTSVLTCDRGTLYNGNNSYLLTLETTAGIYGIGEDGSSTPIVIWIECSISLGDLTSLLPLDNDEYFCLLENESYILTPADVSEIKGKTRLVIASIGAADTIEQSVSKFNNSNSDYYVEIIDYTNGGTIDEADAVSTLNTDMISGNLPDMIDFSSLPPDAYINKGYLTDLRKLFENDSEISLDDIAIAQALDSNGNIYYMGSIFYLETLVAKYSQFGSRYGWTLAEYLEIEGSLTSDSNVLYNTTKEQFLRQICARYIRTAVDWTNGSCDFESDQFIEILEASNRIKENAEEEGNVSAGYGPKSVAQGSLVAANSWVNSVWKLAYEEKEANCQLSFIGWPTVDGSCGSDIHLSDPIGIISQSSNVKGCWAFIKFMLMDADAGDEDGLPVYQPTLESKVENAKTDEIAEVQISDIDAQNLYDLIAATDNIAIYDEKVLEIIEEESVSLFNGDKTAKEVAKIIQSRVGTYIAEQS